MALRRVTLLVLVASASLAAAQPADPLPANPTNTAANTKIPVAGPERTEVLGAEATGSSANPVTVALEHPIDPDTYICGAGDLLELNFWGQQNFRLKIAADLEGRVFISKVGFVPVAGKTLTVVRREIKKRVHDTYPGLMADVVLVTPRTFVVHLVDNVKLPGAYNAQPFERVSGVLARAGGITGSRRRIAIKHRSGEQTTADLVLYELTGDTTRNPVLLDGDVVDVPVTDLEVSISGAVKRPGKYELVDSKDLAELVRIAGGYTSSAAKKLPIVVVRRNEQQQDTSMKVEFDGAAALRDDDRVIVPSAAELERSVELVGAVVGADPVDAATTSRRVPYVEGDTVGSILERAGGVRAPGDLHRSYIIRNTMDHKPTTIPVDLEALLVRRDRSADRPVQINDTVVIPPLRFGVLVEGAVARAGLYAYNPRFGVTEYIAYAGGRTRTARDLDEVKVIDIGGGTHAYSSATRPGPGEAILVPERGWSRPEIVQVVLAGAGLILSGVAITIAATR